MKELSQEATILAVLRDGYWHSAAEIHDRTGPSRLNSRIAGLRHKGHAIVCERAPGVKGLAAYRYRLMRDADRDSAALPPSASTPESDAMGVAPSGWDRAGHGGAGETMAPAPPSGDVVDLMELAELRREHEEQLALDVPRSWVDLA